MLREPPKPRTHAGMPAWDPLVWDPAANEAKTQNRRACWKLEISRFPEVSGDFAGHGSRRRKSCEKLTAEASCRIRQRLPTSASN